MTGYEWRGAIHFDAKDEDDFLAQLRTMMTGVLDVHTSDLSWFDDGEDRAWKRLVPKEEVQIGQDTSEIQYVRTEELTSSTLGSPESVEQAYYRAELESTTQRLAYLRGALGMEEG